MNTRLLAQSSGWDTPNLFRTPRQQAEMFQDVMYYVCPIFMLILFIVCAIAAYKMERKGDRVLFRWIAAAAFILFCWRTYVVYL